MEKSSVVEILRTFSKEELSAFGDFAASPYHNKKSNVTKLLKALKKSAPQYPAEKISKEKIWNNIYPGKKYNYGIMKNLIYDLNRLLLSFLDTEKHLSDSFASDINIVDQFYERRLSGLFLNKLAKTKKEITSAKTDYKIYYYRYILEFMEVKMKNYGYDFKTLGSDPYSKAENELALFYFANQLHNNTNCAQTAHIANVDLHSDFRNLFLSFYNSSGYKDTYIQLLYLSYKITVDYNSIDDYLEMKRLYFGNRKALSIEARYDFAVCLYNFCRNNATKGNKQYSADEFPYIKLIIDEGLYRHSSYGSFDRYMYMGAVMCACRAGEYKWAEKFIEQFASELYSEEREMYKNYAYITLNLRTGNFQKALHYISLCRNVESSDKLNIKVFEFNAYYELGYYEEVISLADTTAHFLRNDKLFSNNDKKAFKNYVWCVRKLINYKCGMGKSRTEVNYLETIEKFIKSNEILNKTWLLKKTEELKSL